MRILYPCAEFHPGSGGVARYATGLALALARAGHEVTVLTEEGGFAPVPHERQRIRPYRGHRSAATGGAALRAADMLRRARREIRDPAYDAVLVGTWLPLGLLAARSRRPFALLVYGSEISIPMTRPGWRTPLLRYVVSRASALLCISSYTERRTRAVLGPAGPPTTVVGTGIDPGYWEALPHVGELVPAPYLLSVGKLSTRKGFPSLIEAFQRSAWSADGHLTIVGGDQRREEALARVRDSGLCGRVRILRDATDPELAALYRDAVGFVLLNDDVRGDYEGFGIVFLEAAIHGLPVVGGRRGGIRDFIEHGRTGLLVDPTDRDEVVRALDLLRSPDRRRALGRSAREKALREFTWDTVAERVEEALRAHRDGGSADRG